MLKKIKLKNSSILLLGFVLIAAGIFIGFLEFFDEKRNKTYSDMNILFYENEAPENITTEEEIEQNKDELIQDDDVDEPVEKPQGQTNYNYIGILEIPKINLKRGFLSLNSKYNNVNYNITVIKGSTYPDEANNNLILAAHSGVCSVCYFEGLYKLSLENEVHLYYKNVKYTYKLVNVYEVEKDGTVPIYRDYSKSVLTLITCTRYSNTKQTVYIFELSSKQNY